MNIKKPCGVPFIYGKHNFITLSQAVGCKLFKVNSMPAGWYGILLAPKLRVWIYA